MTAKTSANTQPVPGMLVAVLGDRYILVRYTDGVWWGGKAQRQNAAGEWVEDRSTFLWPVPVPFRIIEGGGEGG